MIDTLKLSGDDLDLAVALAQGAKIEDQSQGQALIPADGGFLGYVKSYHPSDDWEQGGRIIDLLCKDHNFVVTSDCSDVAVSGFSTSRREVAFGKTLLIAAMRLFVLIKLGPSVNLENLK